MNWKYFILSIGFILFCREVPTQAVTANKAEMDVLGEWVTVDFVKNIEDFNPQKKQWKGDLFLKNIIFYENGETSGPWTWREDFLWHPGDKTKANFTIHEIQESRYLFMECISGDVIRHGMKPRYYVLKKSPVKNQYENSPQNNRRSFTAIQSVDKVDLYDDVRYKDVSKIKSLQNDLMRSLIFNQDTVWPEQSVGTKSIDWVANKILHSSMNPGLGVRKLHKMGITGKGVNVAIIDQPLYQDHPEFKGKIAAYHDVGCGTNSSMHGPAVASLLVGENCGTAPGARLYYVAAPSWTKDAAFQAQALEWIIEQSRRLPMGKKIRIVSVSAAPSGPGSPFDKNNAMWDKACQKAEAEGIVVLDCTQHHGIIQGCFFENRNIENPASCCPGSPSNPWVNAIPTDKLFVPRCPRTTAEEYDEGKCTYAYWGQGGLSWTIPYAAGVLAMGWQLWPDATLEQMKELLLKSAYTDKDGAKIINPPRFIKLVQKTQPKARKP